MLISKFQMSIFNRSANNVIETHQIIEEDESVKPDPLVELRY